MCPVVLLALISSLILFLLELSAALTVVFTPSNITIKEEQTVDFNITLTNIKPIDKQYKYEMVINDTSIANVLSERFIQLNEKDFNYNNYTTNVLIRGKFLGFTNLHIKRRKIVDNYFEMSENRINRTEKFTADERRERNLLSSPIADEKYSQLPIVVTLKQSRLSTIFTISVIVLVSLNYINMGCALDMTVVKNVLRRPIAPVVGFIAQYLMMPLVSFGVGQLLLKESFLRLGLFTFGCSPGGGASNMWTVLLGGNLNLSITMTFISTLAAVFMMPIWLFTLGRSIFVGTTSKVPFSNIISSIGSMAIFLGIGLAFQRYLPKVAKVCRKILAPVSVGMIVFIIIFGTYANLFMFKYMSWRIIISAALNVWIGFLIGLIFSLLLGFPLEDITAISIETGVQNTGIAIILLRLSLDEPYRDLASVVPVAASIMTPIPLTIIWIIRKIYLCMQRKSRDEISSNESIDDNNGNKIKNRNGQLKCHNSSSPLTVNNYDIEKSFDGLKTQI